METGKPEDQDNLNFEKCDVNKIYNTSAFLEYEIGFSYFYLTSGFQNYNFRFAQDIRILFVSSILFHLYIIMIYITEIAHYISR